MVVFPTQDHTLYLDWRTLKGNTFDVFRSGSPQGSYEVIASDLTKPWHVDANVNLYDEGTHYYYVVKAKEGDVYTNETSWSTESYNKPDGIARKVIYESHLVLKVMGNPTVQMLIKKRFADPCPECWNAITQRPKYANCPACFGTGQLAGYFRPVPIRMSRDISVFLDADNELDGDSVAISPINAWMANTPLATPGDVMVDVLNHRFLVQQVAPRTHSGCVVRQVLQLYPLEKGHPAYNVPVDRSVRL